MFYFIYPVKARKIWWNHLIFVCLLVSSIFFEDFVIFLWPFQNKWTLASKRTSGILNQLQELIIVTCMIINWALQQYENFFSKGIFDKTPQMYWLYKMVHSSGVFESFIIIFAWWNARGMGWCVAGAWSLAQKPQFNGAK